MNGEKMNVLVALFAIGSVVCQNVRNQENPGPSNNQRECQSLGLSGRLAVVTGGASGIGRSVCMVLAREGATVVIADRNRTGSIETLQMLQASYNGGHLSIHVDVSNSTAVSALFKKVEVSFPDKKISIVVNCAGIVGDVVTIEKTSDSDFDDVLATNLKGTFLIDQASVKHMLANNVTDGAIVNIASIFGKTGCPQVTPYSASKGGVVSLTKAVALEVAGRGIRVNAILPGPVDTPMLQKLPQDQVAIFVASTALKRKARPEEISETIAFICSPKSSFLTGAAVEVTGGI